MSCCISWLMWAVPMGLLWWLLCSMLVWYTWNNVVSVVTTAGKLNFKHALLVVFTLGCLCMPHRMASCWKGPCKRDMMQLQMESPDGSNMHLDLDDD